MVGSRGRGGDDAAVRALVGFEAVVRALVGQECEFCDFVQPGAGEV